MDDFELGAAIDAADNAITRAQALFPVIACSLPRMGNDGIEVDVTAIVRDVLCDDKFAMRLGERLEELGWELRGMPAEPDRATDLLEACRMMLAAVELMDDASGLDDTHRARRALTEAAEIAREAIGDAEGGCDVRT